MHIRSTITFAVFGLAVLCASPVLAQQPDQAAAKQALQQKVAALKDSMARGKAALTQYSWLETTTISMKGEVKKQEQKRCRYGPDGEVAKTPEGAAAPPPQQEESHGRRGRRGGAVKAKIVEKKVGEIKDYMDRFSALIKQYAPPEAAKMQAAVQEGRAEMSPGADTGIATLTIRDYLKSGDEVKLSINNAANRLESYEVRSWMDKPDDAVSMTVRFNNLADGAFYSEQTLLDAPGKHIQVKVTNSGHQTN